MVCCTWSFLSLFGEFETGRTHPVFMALGYLIESPAGETCQAGCLFVDKLMNKERKHAVGKGIQIQKHS